MPCLAMEYRYPLLAALRSQIVLILYRGRRSRRSLIAFAIAVTVSAFPQASAGSIVAAVAGETVIRIDVPRSQVLEVSQPITIDAAPVANSTISVRGEARSAILILRRLGPEENRPTLIVSWLAGDTICGSACLADPYVWVRGFSMEGTPGGPIFVLPAGRYQMYTAAFGGVATVTLSVPELPGQVFIQPDGPAHIERRELSGTQYPENIYSSGASSPVGASGGIAISALWVVTSLHVGGLYGNCSYMGDPPPVTAYAPGCPQASVALLAPELRVAPDGVMRTLDGVTVGVPEGTWSEGWFFTLSARVQGAGGFVVWVDV